MLQSQIAYLLEQLNNSEPEPQQLSEEEVEMVKVPDLVEEPTFHTKGCSVSTSQSLNQFSQELGGNRGYNGGGHRGYEDQRGLALFSRAIQG